MDASSHANSLPAPHAAPAGGRSWSRSGLLWAASLRHFLHHPAQLALAFLGLSLGVATITAVDIATASSRRAFELSMAAVNGAATHQIIGGPQGIDESLYLQLRQELHTGSDPAAAAIAPAIEGYVTAGDHSLTLIGLDPFASGELDAGSARSPLPIEEVHGNRESPGSSDSRASIPGLETLAQWFTRPGAAVLSQTTAREIGAVTGGEFPLAAGGVRHVATLMGTIHDDAGGHDTLVLADIATAQEWLGMSGHLTRLDLRVPKGAAGTQLLKHLAALLPPGVQLREAAGSTQESLDMTGAFTTNLQAMSLLALLVSALLIYGAISFAVVQRRRLIGILRALGATRGQVLAIVLTETGVLGLLGAAAGLGAGILIGQGLVRLVSRTINDLYFVVAVNQTVLPAASILKAFAGGLLTALIAGLLPALEVAASPPQLGLRRSSLESRAVYLARQLVIASVLLAAGAGVVILLSQRSLFAGFAALFMLLLSVAALTPAVLRALAQGAARITGPASPVARLALGSIAASLSRTGVAVAALGMALAAMIGVSIMVASFRESLADWLTQSMSADLYITAPGLGAEPERRIDPAVLAALAATPGVAGYTQTRIVNVPSEDGSLTITAVDRRPGTTTRPLVPGTDPHAWEELDRGALIISEPLAWRLQRGRGDHLTLVTAEGPRALPIAGVFRDYGTGRGAVLMNRTEYRRLWHDDSVTGIAVYLAPGARPRSVQGALRAASRGRQALLIRSDAQLRSMSMSIFDRTFVITRVLNWLAAGVAAVGLVSSLLAWELERSHELAILRSLGLTPRGAGLLIELQTGFMGLAALLAAIPAGLLTAYVLTNVINRRAFGWQIDLHISAGQLSSALWLAVAAALAAGLYPAWRIARAPIAADIREE